MRDWEHYVRERLALDGLRPERERRIVRELASQLEDACRDAIAQGLPAEEAERAAAAQVSDWGRLSRDLRSADPAAREPRIDRLAERFPEAPPPGTARRPWTGLRRDAVQALRRLAAAPGFTAVAVVVLALGIGGAALMFNLVDTLVFQPLPVERAHEIVRVFEDDDDGQAGTCSYPTYLEFAAQREVFSGVTAAIVGRDANWLTGDGTIRRVAVEFAASTYFPTLGLAPALGRSFERGEDAPGGAPAAVLGFRFWRAAFDADPAVVGRVVKLAGAPVTIVGVGPRGFDGILPGHSVDFWLSLSALGPVWGEYAGGTLQRRGDHWFNIVARLRPGVSVEQARAAAAVTAARLARGYPEYHRGRKMSVLRASEVRLQPGLDGSLYSAAAMLMGVSGLVLLVGCANLAGLLLAGGWKRRHELSIRLALGATRWRLVRQLLVESVLLGAAGGLAGTLLAAWGARLFSAASAALSLPLQLTVSIDPRTLAFAALATLAVGVVSGIGPALRLTRGDLVSGLKEPEAMVPTRRAEGRPARLSLRGVFIVAQVAASMLLLGAGSLLVAGVRDAQRVNMGFGAAGRLALLEADASQAGLDGPEAGAVLREFAGRARSLPGVEALSWTTRPPATAGSSSTLVIDEYRRRTGAETAEVDFAYVGAGYFDTLRIPIRAGRGFTEDDATARRRVAVVNETMARRFWGRPDVVGERYRHQGGSDSWVEIVGVAADVKVSSPTEAPTPMFYRPLAAGDVSRMSIVARTSGPPEAVARAMQRLFRLEHPGVPVLEAGTMAGHLARSITLQRAAATTVSIFGAVALLLAAIGLYGVVAGSVAQRTAEIGVRMALGARPGQVVAMLVREVMGMVAIGSGLGLFAAVAAAPGLRRLVFGTGGQDSLAVAAATGLLALVALLAAWLPARRAVRSGPLPAMRAK